MMRWDKLFLVFAMLFLLSFGVFAWSVGEYFSYGNINGYHNGIYVDNMIYYSITNSVVHQYNSSDGVINDVLFFNPLGGHVMVTYYD